MKEQESQSLSIQLQDPFVRGAIFKTVLVLLFLFAVVGVLGITFEAQLLSATSRVAETVGQAGLMLFVLVSDFFPSPVPPDLVLFVVAKSGLRESAGYAIPLLGLASVFAGNLGWWLGWKLGDHSVSRRLFGQFRESRSADVKKYGKVAVALGALTPVPFSLTCWSAGVFKMPWRDFFLVSLLRIPRFWLGYLVILSSDSVAAWFR